MSDTITNTDYRLQILHHDEVFSDRTTAMKYIVRNVYHQLLAGEPAVFFYGDEDEPNAILAIGDGNSYAALIDNGQIKESIDALSEITKSSETSVADAIALIEDIITSTGVTYDTNKTDDVITYEPDATDSIIGSSTSIAEAVAALSSYVQEKYAELNIEHKDSASISFETEESGSTIVYTPSVNISEYGSTDSNTVNDNIIGIKSDGLYVAVDMSYDDTTKTLTFVTSGVDSDGNFVDDAKVKTFELGEHVEYTAENTDNTVVVTVDNDEHVVSANVRLSEEEYNLLTTKEGGYLYASSKAESIIYDDTTVYATINEVQNNISALEDTTSTLQESITTLEDTDWITGDETDTLTVTSEKKDSGVYKISGDVRLGSNNSIITSNGGLEVNMTFKSDLTNNQLIITLGDTTYTLDYPALDIISSAYYDSDTGKLVLLFNNGSEVQVSLSQLLITYTFSNSTSSPIHFDTETSGTATTVTATLLLASTDNMLSIDSSGYLTAPLSTVTDAVAVETERATAVEETLTTNLSDEIDRAKTTEGEIANNITVLTSTVEALDVRVTTNEEDIETINADENTVNSIRYIVNHAMEDEVANRENADSTLQTQIDSLSSSITSIESNIDSITDSSSSYATTNALAEEAARATAAEEALSEELDTKIESVTITKSESSDLIYYLNVDGTVTEINIPEDQFLQSVTYDSDTKVLQFVFTVNGEAQVVNISVSDLVDTYTAGDGLTESDNVFSIVINPDSESYLTVTSSGLSLQGIDDALALKADTDSVYAKDEVDATVATLEANTTSVSDALAEEVARATAAEEVLSSSLSELESRVSDTESNIEDLDEELTAQNLIVEETNTVKLTKSKESDGTTLTADVKINSDATGNILQYNGNGLYATVSLTYDESTNTLTFTTGANGDVDIPLASGTLLESATYDTDSNVITLVFVTGDTTNTITIPASDLVQYVEVVNTTNNPIILSKEITDGTAYISASLNISTASDNGLLNDNGTLYVSNDANSLYGTWDDEYLTIQQIIARLKSYTDQVDGIVEDIEELQTNVTSLQNSVSNIEEDVDDLETQVATNTTNITTNTANIATLEGTTTAMSATITEISNSVATVNERLTTVEEELEESIDELSEKVDENANDIDALETSVSELNGSINTISIQMTTLSSTVSGAVSDIEELKEDVEEQLSDIDTRLSTAESEIDELQAITESGVVASGVYDEDSNSILLYDTNKNVLSTIDTTEFISSGDGIEIDGGTISAVKSSSSEDYLTIDSTGISITGIDSIKTTVASNSTSITAIDSRVTSAESNITSLKTSVSELTVDVSSIEARVTLAESDIDSVEDSISELEDSIEAVETSVTTAESNITKLQALTTSSLVASAVYSSSTQVITLSAADGTVISTIDASQFVMGGILESVEVVDTDADGNSGTFLYMVFATADDESTALYVDVADMMTVYSAGNGITITDGVIAAKKSAASEDYLTIDGTGISISGIDTIEARVTSVEDELSELTESLGDFGTY